MYSVEVPPAFTVNLFKGQVSFGSLELTVGAAVICQLRDYKRIVESPERGTSNSSSRSSSSFWNLWQCFEVLYQATRIAL